MGLRIKAGAINSCGKLLHEDFINSKYNQFETVFHSLLKELEINQACFLIKKDNFFVAAFPYGLSVNAFHKIKIEYIKLIETVKSSEKTPFLFKDFSLFESFFSTNDYEKIKEIILYPMEENDSSFLLLIKSAKKDKNLAADGIKEKIKNFIPQYNANKKILENSKCICNLNGIISIESKLNGAALQNANTSLIKFSFNEIFGEIEKNCKNLNFLRLFYSIVNKIISSIGKSNLTVLDRYFCLNACIFSISSIDETLYTAQLKEMLAELYGKEIAESLNIEFPKHDNIQKELKSWLEKSYEPLTD